MLELLKRFTKVKNVKTTDMFDNHYCYITLNSSVFQPIRRDQRLGRNIFLMGHYGSLTIFKEITLSIKIK